MQEIQACAKRKDIMFYFASLITSALCSKHGVKDKETDEITNPKATFDRNSLQVFMKPKARQQAWQASLRLKEM